jgi:hypothetical protein
LSANFLEKSLIKNLLKKGFIENGMMAWSSGATVGDKPAQRFRRIVSGQRLCCTLTPVCFSLQVQAGAKIFQVLMTI